MKIRKVHKCVRGYPRQNKFLTEIIQTIVSNLSKYIGMMVRVFANGQGNLGSIPGRVVPKTQKMVLEVCLLNTQLYKVGIKCKVKQSRERSSSLPYTAV